MGHITPTPLFTALEALSVTTALPQSHPVFLKYPERMHEVIHHDFKLTHAFMGL